MSEWSRDVLHSLTLAATKKVRCAVFSASLHCRAPAILTLGFRAVSLSHLVHRHNTLIFEREEKTPMKAALLVIFVALLSGCSLVRQAPSEAKAQALEYSRRDAESARHALAEAGKLVERGLTTREASSLADAQRRVAR